MRATWWRVVPMGLLVLAVAAGPVWAVTKKLTVTGTAGKTLKITANTPAGPVDVKAEKEDDDRRVAAYIPDDASSVTVTDVNTGRTVVVDGPFDGGRTIAFSSLFGGAGMAGGSNAFTQWLKSQGFSDFRFLMAGGAGFSTTNVGGTASSNLGGLGNFSSMKDYGRLPGSLARFGIELGVPQIMGVQSMFFGLAGSKFWGRSDSFRADLDPISAGEEATSKHKVNYAIDAYIGKRFPFACGGRECTFSGRVGGSLVSTKNSLTIMEAGVTQRFKDTNREFAPYWGGSVEFPVLNFGGGTDLKAYLSADFRYIAGSSMTNRSQLGLTYSNSYCGYVDFNPTAGFVLVFDP